MITREKWKELSSLSILEAALLKFGIDPDHHEENCYSEPGYEEYFGSHVICDQVDITINALFDAVRSRVIEEVSRSPRIDGSVGASDVRILKSDYLKWLHEHGCPDALAAFSYQDNKSGQSVAPVTSASEPDNFADTTEEKPWTRHGLRRREQQILIIESLADEFEYERMSIPDGGKMKIGKKCKASYMKWFGVGDDPFKDAWQEAVTLCRIRMSKHHQYSRE